MGLLLITYLESQLQSAMTLLENFQLHPSSYRRFWSRSSNQNSDFGESWSAGLIPLYIFFASYMWIFQAWHHLTLFLIILPHLDTKRASSRATLVDQPCIICLKLRKQLIAPPRQTSCSQRHRWWTASCLEHCNRISREEHKMGALCPRFVQTNPDKETQQGRAEGAASVTCANNL